MAKNVMVAATGRHLRSHTFDIQTALTSDCCPHQNRLRTCIATQGKHSCCVGPSLMPLHRSLEQQQERIRKFHESHQHLSRSFMVAWLFLQLCWTREQWMLPLRPWLSACKRAGLKQTLIAGIRQERELANSQKLVGRFPYATVNGRLASMGCAGHHSQVWYGTW